VLIDELLDEVVAFFQRNQLERRPAIDGDHHGLVMAEIAIAAQIGFGFTQWNDFHVRLTDAATRKVGDLECRLRNLRR